MPKQSLRVESPLELQAQVVVVEDDASLVELIRELLALEGYTSVDLRPPYQLDPRHKPPRLFLIDIMLAGGDGIEVAGRLRREGYRATPMIAMSASPARLERAGASGLFSETLPKPFAVEHVLARVARYVRPVDPAQRERREEPGSGADRD